MPHTSHWEYAAYLPSKRKCTYVALQKTDISPIEEAMRPKCKGHIRTYVRHRNICSIRLILKTRRNCNCSNFAPMCDFIFLHIRRIHLQCDVYASKKIALICDSPYNATYDSLKKAHLQKMRLTSHFKLRRRSHLIFQCDLRHIGLWGVATRAPIELHRSGRRSWSPRSSWNRSLTRPQNELFEVRGTDMVTLPRLHLPLLVGTGTENRK